MELRLPEFISQGSLLSKQYPGAGCCARTYASFGYGTDPVKRTGSRRCSRASGKSQQKMHRVEAWQSKSAESSDILKSLENRMLAGCSFPSFRIIAPSERKHRKGAVKVNALDAAMPFDYESRKKRELEQRSQLKIGIVGFGNFGQFLARRLRQHGHAVLAWSRSDYSSIAKELGVTFFTDADDFCEEHPEVVLLATSILSTDRVLRGLPLQRLKRSTLFVDVLSVKAFPKNLFLQVLPPEFDILCTHPMFGPESGAGSWAGLPFVYDRVRIGDSRRRQERCRHLLDFFTKEGCRMVEMTSEEHDRYAAGSQFITHTVGRVLSQLGLESTPINTKGYETLLNLVQNTSGDSFDLYYGLFMYNINATEELQRLEQAFDAVKKQLFDQLHDILRKQLFEKSVETAGGSVSNLGLKLAASAQPFVPEVPVEIVAPMPGHIALPRPNRAAPSIDSSNSCKDSSESEEEEIIRGFPGENRENLMNFGAPETVERSEASSSCQPLVVDNE